ncbi:uncharacterized protein LOC127438046 [Myxocyprinus asiaticus]|uniref:uncharacterized protein LOC127438046 n=1 Tax=Myxocyprinus asiaticus TaxID=70543 RepID=UPI0022231A6A|nr:uncharacterized protein LOC127438046 [Myxocyprinus asiaticus]
MSDPEAHRIKLEDTDEQRVLFGVVTGEINTASVMEGDFVTLQTGVVKQRGDLIVWYFGSENTLVAQINGKANSNKIYDDVDGRFGGRLTLDNQTGSLTIKNITTVHSGLYKLKISSSNKVSYKTFNVTVNETVITGYSPQNSSSEGQSNSKCVFVLCSVMEVPNQVFSILPTLVAVCMTVVLIIVLTAVICYRKHINADQKGFLKVSHAETNVLTEERRFKDNIFATLHVVL